MIRCWEPHPTREPLVQLIVPQRPYPLVALPADSKVPRLISHRAMSCSNAMGHGESRSSMSQTYDILPAPAPGNSPEWLGVRDKRIVVCASSLEVELMHATRNMVGGMRALTYKLEPKA